MATIAIMVGGTVLNVATFIGGNYLAKALSGDSSKAAMYEKIRHDKALEAYQAAYAKFQKDRTELLDWVAEQDHEKYKAIHIFKIPTEHWPSTIKHTEQRWPFLKNPSSLTSTSLVHSKRMVNYCSSVRARLHLDAKAAKALSGCICFCDLIMRPFLPRPMVGYMH